MPEEEPEDEEPLLSPVEQASDKAPVKSAKDEAKERLIMKVPPGRSAACRKAPALERFSARHMSCSRVRLRVCAANFGDLARLKLSAM